MKVTEKYRPDRYYNNVWEIDYEELVQKGLTNLIFDVDNTIAPSTSSEIDPKAKEKILEILNSDRGFKACLVSNIIIGKHREMRVKKMADELGIPYFAARFFQKKPGPIPFLKGMGLIGSKPENTVMVGDQLAVDILGANLLGLFTILVNPLGQDHWATRFFGFRRKHYKLLKMMDLKPIEKT